VYDLPEGAANLPRPIREGILTKGERVFDAEHTARSWLAAKVLSSSFVMGRVKHEDGKWRVWWVEVQEPVVFDA
jgi:hypothetical protein